MKISVNKYECKLCKHVWISRVEMPKQCPICKRPDWNKKK